MDRANRVERQCRPDRVWVRLLSSSTVPRPRLEERQDDQRGGSALQPAVERAGVDTCHEQIVCRQVFEVKGLACPSVDGQTGGRPQTAGARSVPTRSSTSGSRSIRDALADPLPIRPEYARVRRRQVDGLVKTNSDVGRMPRWRDTHLGAAPASLDVRPVVLGFPRGCLLGARFTRLTRCPRCADLLVPCIVGAGPFGGTSHPRALARRGTGLFSGRS